MSYVPNTNSVISIMKPKLVLLRSMFYVNTDSKCKLNYYIYL